MKKSTYSILAVLIFLVVVAAPAIFLFTGCDVSGPTTSEKTAAAATAAMDRAAEATPIPQVTNFLERKTIAKWVETWDKPSVPCYVYLYSYGVCVGYYVSNGKPASTQSYLIPESSYQRLLSNDNYSVHTMAQAPDLDGTYGTNNPGIRFFTAGGIAVEWAGAGATYLYSNAPIKTLNVPLLGE